MTVRSRRRFLAETARIAGGGWLTLGMPGLLAAATAAAEQKANGSPWVNLSAAEAKAVTALVDRIIPKDDLPSASEVGVVHFVDQALGGFFAGGAAAFAAGLHDLDARAASAHPGHAAFADLTEDEQDALLRTIENSPFFSQAIFLTHCGMFALPSWGGNRDQMGWALVGFDSRHAWQPPFGYYDAQLLREEEDHAG